ncbi:MAG TPA: SDR family oxidoreductase [Pseudonocardiaceae bacterium]|nr:SDR family oxidoreductase [Pseudonocardiaceae bacterium]
MPITVSLEDQPELVIGCCPFGQPNPRLVAAVTKAGGLGVLDLGAGDRRSRQALSQALRWAAGPIALRVSAHCALTAAEFAALPGVDSVPTIILAADAPFSPDELPGRRVLAEVTSLAEALRALAAGAAGLIARGNESGGRVGELSTFVLLQQLLTDDRIAVGVWAAGGIGPRTAAAAVVGGAAGVVLDTQLGLLTEADLPVEVANALRGMDGSETVVSGGHRMLRSRAAGRAPAREPLPVGQDGCLAAQFARRWRDVGGTVRAIRDAVLDTVRQGPASTALRADSSMSRALGTTLPVAQGPMTRVSDGAAFAAAVAEEGGLPFVALALADGARSREILLRARAALAGRSWGVGILGFVAEETRAAQLEVIREVRPSHVIIAGGRPAQAAVLEEVGIATFLHVPSPGLLAQFLAGGARKFVFEGAECGGHIGPRNSFPLWEAQIGVIEEFLDAKGAPEATAIQVLFAGGVHDARSAAMVAALAAPLVARGVAVGVLMGTGYLFTEEAVAHGAIRPVFQRQVVAAAGTDLLETAPGHATRCASSPFTASFRDKESALRDSGLADREVWERLEQLNVGRLRVASKGVERRGEDLVEVDEARQLTEGLFMAGEVAVLRSAVTTIAELHESVTSGAADFLDDRLRLLTARFGEVAGEPAAPAPVDVAVVGMAAMLPGAGDLDAFWSNVVRGVDSITEVPAQRWDARLYYSPDGAPNTTPSKWGGFLPEIPFDPLSYGIPPAALGSIEPVQLLALEAARRALADAGYGQRPFDRSRTAVLFGAEAGSDLSNASVLRTVLPAYVGALPDELSEQLPELTEDSFPGMLANVIAGRIANRLDLGGANYTVDAACASSLAAVDIACKELAAGSSDLVLCGGADLHNGINDYLLFSSVHALSPTGRSRTFDQHADGIALGEGVGCVVLKRLADAERDGDRIYAVIKGVGGASDGKSLGLTAPRPEGQRAALERAYRNAGVSPAEVGLVEAHGTGTVVGDRTELATLTKVFTEAGAQPGSCVLGSVKSQIGHTKCAAGLAGLIKTSLALYHGVRPGTLNLLEPNPAWEPDTSPFAFHTAARPWPVPAGERVAGVSAFGFGGTNFHVVLRGYDNPPPVHALPEWPVELFVFRGSDREVANRAAQRLLATVTASGSRRRLRDFALTTALRADAEQAPVRIAIVAGDLAELAGKLTKAVAGEADPAAGIFLDEGADKPGVAFLFPGQGSQRAGMLAELFVAFPELHRYLELGREWAGVLHPPAAFTAERQDAQQAGITDTTVAQPALGIAGLAVNDLLGRAGVVPDMVAGHSYGELVALCTAGVLDPDALIGLSARRAAAILASTGTDAGAMAAVSSGGEKVDRVLHDLGLAEQVVIANHNAPEQTVISGPTEAIELAVRRLRDTGISATRIPVACAFHSPLVAASARIFAEALADTPMRAPEITVYANRTALGYPGDPALIKDELAAQLAAPVRFAEEIEAMYAAGARVFVEAGPGSVLTKLVGKILGDRPHRAIAAQPSRRGDLHGFLLALAQLAVAGVEVRTSWLVDGRGAADLDKAGEDTRPGWTVDGQLVRTANGDIPAGGLVPARRMQEATVFPQQPPQPQFGDQEALIAEFLRSSREMVAAQRDVLLSYLGTAPSAPRPAAVPASLAVAPAVIDTPAAQAAPAAAPVPVAEAAPVDLQSTVLGIVADRTGYPVDMIEPDLDLEADLSIDSIKRAEIAGEIAIRLGIDGSLADDQIEDLAKARTIAAITAWLSTRAGGEQVATELVEQPPTSIAPAPADVPVVEAPRRLLIRQVPLGTPDGPSDLLRDKRFLLVGGEERVTAALSAGLAEHGAAAVTVPADHQLSARDAAVDGVLHLAPLAGTEEELFPGVFPLYQDALRRGVRWLIAVAPAGTPEHAVGLRGFFRTVVREYPDTVARVVEVDPTGNLVPLVLAELRSTEIAPVVLHARDGRHGLRPVEAGLGALATNGAGPEGAGSAEAQAIGLDRDSVVLLLGGARGITARFAGLLASTSRCRIHLAGRTALPDGPEDAATASALDAVALRNAVIAAGAHKPAEVERAVSRILAEREVAGTLAELTALGSEVRYHSVDARDAEAVARLVKEVYAEHGRLDGVVHAAGVIADRLIEEKDVAAFNRVYETKVRGAQGLLDAVADLPAGPAFTVLFGSISAVLGNRGQADYAAANDALESLGARWASTTGNRALTVHWGPWAATGGHDGMVTEGLMREYGRRGIRLIDPEEGVLALLRELAWGEQTDAVVYTASGW